MARTEASDASAHMRKTWRVLALSRVNRFVALMSVGKSRRTPRAKTPARDSAVQADGGLALKAIALFKLFKALTLIAAGLGAWGLLNPSWDAVALSSLDQLSLEHGRRFASYLAAHVLPYLTAATPQRLVALALGSFLYASIFLVESAGLWRRKRWAEYLTVLVTASLLPFEIVAIFHVLTRPRVITLVLNIMVVTYLL